MLWFAFSVKNNVTNCPLFAPFFDGAKCISCSGGTPFFDLSLRKCIAAKGIDKNKQCIDPSFGSTDKDGMRDKGRETPTTFKEVSVNPLVADPIVKSVTFNRERKTREKIVNPIEGKALVDKEERITNTKYIEIPAIVSLPDVKLIRTRARS